MCSSYVDFIRNVTGIIPLAIPAMCVRSVLESTSDYRLVPHK